MVKEDLYYTFFKEVSLAQGKESVHNAISRYTGRIGLDCGKFFLKFFRGPHGHTSTLEEFYMLALVLTARLGNFEGDGEELWHEIALSLAEQVLERLPPVPGLVDNIYLLLTLADLRRVREYGERISNIRTSLHYYKEAIEICTPANDRKLVTCAWLGQGECYKEMNYLQIGNYTNEEICNY